MSFEGWRKGSLKEIAYITMGQSPSGDECNKEHAGTPLLNGPTEFTTKYPKPVQYTEDVKKVAKKGDILFCVRGSTTGRMNWADRDYAIGRGIASIRPIHMECAHFVKATVDINLNELLSCATGSTFPNISRPLLENLEVNIPPLSEQKAIASNLSTLDDKIELHNQMNKKLEEMARAIFKSWFLDFEPFKDEEFEESELGMIPKGWGVVNLKSHCEVITKGTTPTTLKKQFVEIGINFVKAESITDSHYFDYNKFAHIDYETNELLKRSIIKVDDILFTIAGTIGRYALVTEDILPANTNQAIGIIRIDKSKMHPLFILCLFLCNQHKNYFESKVVQAVQANLSLGVIGDLPVIVPNKEIFEKFVEIVKPIFKLIETNNIIINNLSSIRKSILPKLMSGEIRVPQEV